MRPLYKLAVLLFLVCGVSMTAADTLTIIHVNDTHSNLAAGGRRDGSLQGTVGGIARAATYIGMARATDPNVVVVHGGDMSIGDLFYQKYFGVAELKIMGALGFDVMTLGNHEFDLTPAVLMQAYGAAFSEGQPFAIVSSNVILEADEVQPLKSYISENYVKQVGDIKVGFFGMLTPETNLLSQPSPAVIDTNIVPIAIAQVEALRAQGCDVVIMLSHLGSHIDRLVAMYVSDIDAIIGAHSHEMITADPLAPGTPIVQAGAFYHTVGRLQLEVADGNVRLLSSTIDDLDGSVPEEPTVAALVAGMIAEIEEVYGPVYTQQIATAAADIEQLATDLDEEGSHATPLGNLICDAFLAWGKTDVAVEPGGSVAQNLFQGPLVAADAFRAISYGFNLKNGLGYRMTRFTVLGAELLAGIEFGLMDLGSDEFLSQVGGMAYQYDPSKPPTQRLTGAMVGSAPIDPSKRYSVTANEFVMMFFGVLGFTPQDVVVNEDTTEFMVLAGYIAALETVDPNTDPRVMAKIATSVSESPKGTVNWFAKEVTDGQINVDVAGVTAEALSVEFYDSSLRILPVSFTVSQQADSVHLTAPAHTLPSGVYILKMRSGNETHLGRILVVH